MRVAEIVAGKLMSFSRTHLSADTVSKKQNLITKTKTQMTKKIKRKNDEIVEHLRDKWNALYWIIIEQIEKDKKEKAEMLAILESKKQ
jgi:hypothetical protein